ncbi:hypothetical protein LT493_40985 [Streptomyces tricolor]|nr:hypothetical protein [Streptomyces tricolor]
MLARRRRSGPPRSSTRSLSARASPSTPCRPPPCTPTIANGGVRVEPTLVRGTKGADGRFTPAPKPKQTRVVSARTAKTLAQMLESVVDDEQGTGVKARIPGYRVAARPAPPTAWIRHRPLPRLHLSSFAGFAPADNPGSPSTAPSRTPPGQLLRWP